MAPEQIRNLKLTSASDLYGLGLTLICLIGAIRSTDIGNYIDFSNQLDRSKIDPKLKGCSLTFVKWLDQMVAPDPSKRFANAKTALKGLQPLYVTRYPSVEISKSSLEFKATSLGEKLTQTITLSNSTPETILLLKLFSKVGGKLNHIQTIHHIRLILILGFLFHQSNLRTTIVNVRL
jgi:serine/threonine protein kinase